MRRSVIRRSLFVVGMLLVVLLIPCAGITPVQAAVVTVTVNDTVDEVHSPGCATTGTGTCSLRDAMKFAATAGGSTTITLGANATYPLTIVDDPTVGSPTGLPTIVTSENLTIIGNGATVTRSMANGTPAFRLLHVASCGMLALTNLTLSNGLIANDIATVALVADGGAIYNEGTLTIANATLSNNTAAAMNTKTSGGGNGGAGGGAIFNTGTLMLATVILTGNKATVTSSQTGASANMHASGGAIVNLGTASLIAHTVVSGNAATVNDTQHDTVDAAGGGIMYAGSPGVPLTVSDSSVSGNTVSVVAHNANPGSGAIGGGLATFFNPGAVIITNSTISNNTVTLDTVAGSSAPAGPGGISTALQTFVLTNSTVSNNSVTNMNSTGAVYGGVQTIGPTTITGSTISGNTASGGGGIYLNLSGGGLVVSDVSSGTNTVTNTTISNNTSPHVGGIFVTSASATLKLIHTTIAGNTTGIAGSTSGTATVSLQNTILANTGANCVGGQITSADYNLTSDATCTTLTASHDRNSANPMLGPLQLNAPGTTETQALLSGSPAIDQIPNTGGCNGAGVTTDQRGVARPQPVNGLCDIGAYEVSPSVRPARTTPAITPVLTGPTCGGPVLTSIAVTVSSTTVTVGATQPFKATGTYADSTTADITSSVIWSSDTPTVATIVTGGASAGLATGVAAGTAKMSALLSGVVGSIILTVTGGPPPPSGLQFYPLSKPVRLLDTRAGATAFVHPNTPLSAGQTLPLPGQFAYQGVTVPPTAQAIVGNATVANGANGTPAGFATIFPSGVPQPLTSNLNFVPGTVRPNNFTVALGADTKFNLFSSSGGDFVIDLSGYYAPAGAGGLYFHPLSAPVRELDTRAGATADVTPGRTLAAGETLTLPGSFTFNDITVPASAKALVGNATVANNANGTPAGFATLYPDDVSLPLASNLNFVPGTVAPNAFTVALGGGGGYKLYTSSGGDFVLDITGYLDTVASGGLLFTPLAAPVRELDTRVGATAAVTPNATLTAGQTLSLPGSFTFAGITVPVAAKALVGNATVANDGNGTPAGFATLYPDGVPLPLASNLNFVAKQVAPNALVVGVGSDGKYDLYTSSGGDFVIDISGYFS